MAVMWTHLASAASRLCEPIKPCELETSKSQLQEQVAQLQSVLEEMRHRLNHEQRVSEELQLQLKDERTRRERHQRTMQDQLDIQCIEIERLHAQLEKAQAVRLQKRELLPEPQDKSKSETMKFDVCKAHESEKQLLAALLDHACIRCARENSAREEGSILQELRKELEVAQRKASEEQKAAEALREKLQNEEAVRHELEQLNELQWSYYLKDFDRNRAFRAEVTEFLQQLGQQYPGMAKELATASAEPLSPYGAGGG
ncbi:ZIFL1 [Symbiodinium sp. CCMP2456]|nr:ZIFL1 [Symbiodinium sp. CCMP2456]